MKLFIIFLAAVLVMAWLGATCGHIMDRRVKAAEAAHAVFDLEEIAR